MRHPLFLLITLLAFVNVAAAQKVEVRTMSVTSKARRMDKDTKIYDKETGRRVSFEEFSQINRNASDGFHLVPQFDEYGNSAYYVMRTKTKEERETGHIYTQEDYKKPAIGQTLPPFIMQGVDGKTYSSEELKGKYVLLSFWIRLGKPFFRGDSETKDLVALAEIARKRGIPLVSLGTTSDGKEECQEATDTFTLGFVPVPESYDFMKRYGVFRPGTYFLISSEGTLLAIVEQDSPLPLQKYLTR